MKCTEVPRHGEEIRREVFNSGHIQTYVHALSGHIPVPQDATSLHSSVTLLGIVEHFISKDKQVPMCINEY